MSDEATRPGAPGQDRSVPAPGLRETAQIWWDAGADPVVTWDQAGRRFRLQGPGPGDTLTLWVARAPCPDPAGVATALADGLAACDFPPTADGVDVDRAAATLRAAGVTVDRGVGP